MALNLEKTAFVVSGIDPRLEERVPLTDEALSEARATGEEIDVAVMPAKIEPYSIVDGKKWLCRSPEDEAGIAITEYNTVLSGLALRATLRLLDAEGAAELMVQTVPPVLHQGLLTTVENGHPVDMHGAEEPARLTFIPDGINVR